MDLNFTPFYWTQAGLEDVDHRIEVLGEGKQPERDQDWIVLPDAGVRGSDRYQRYQRLGRVWGLLSQRDDLTAMLAQGVGSSFREQRGIQPRRVRCRRHMLQGWDVSRSGTNAQRNPDDPSYFQVAYDANLVICATGLSASSRSLRRGKSHSPPHEMAQRMDAISNYLRRLTDEIGAGWNRFWFTPTAPDTVCALCILVGLAAVYFVVSHTADLAVWFGTGGLLPRGVVEQLTGATQEGSFGPRPLIVRWSYFNWIDNAPLLWTAHFAGLAVVLAFTVGLFSRVSGALSLVVVLSYVHRAPMIVGQFDAVLTILLLLLWWAPTGSRWSLDRWLARRRAAPATKGPGRLVDSGEPLSVAANISQRLLQVHVAALYLLMALTQLAGQVWWAGEAVWWLMARTESRLVDLTALSGSMYLVNLWTHGIVLFELVFALLVWNRLARPLLLASAIVLWVPLALLTGEVSFCVLMLVANLAFLPPAILSRKTQSQDLDIAPQAGPASCQEPSAPQIVSRRSRARTFQWSTTFPASTTTAWR